MFESILKAVLFQALGVAVWIPFVLILHNLIGEKRIQWIHLLWGALIGGISIILESSRFFSQIKLYLFPYFSLLLPFIPQLFLIGRFRSNGLLFLSSGLIYFLGFFTLTELPRAYYFDTLSYYAYFTEFPVQLILFWFCQMSLLYFVSKETKNVYSRLFPILITLILQKGFEPLFLLYTKLPLWPRLTLCILGIWGTYSFLKALLYHLDPRENITLQWYARKGSARSFQDNLRLFRFFLSKGEYHNSFNHIACCYKLTPANAHILLHTAISALLCKKLGLGRKLLRKALLSYGDFYSEWASGMIKSYKLPLFEEKLLFRFLKLELPELDSAFEKRMVV